MNPKDGNLDGGDKLLFSTARIGLKIFLKHVLLPIGLFVPKAKGQRVLFYHRVNNHPFKRLGLVSRELSVRTERFEQQMAHLHKKGIRTLTVAEFKSIVKGEAPVDPKALLLTFDDGYLDNLTNAAPILAKYGLNAVVFPISTLIGKTNAPMPMSDPADLGQFMSDDHLLDWLSLGHEVGSHTCTHPALTQLNTKDLNTELRQSKDDLNGYMEETCPTICYPMGYVDQTVIQASKTAGYQLGFTTQSGVNQPNCDLLAIRRTEVSASDTFLLFKCKLIGTFDWLGFRDSENYRHFIKWLNSRLTFSSNRSDKVRG